jgi:adenylosuccinate synthase
LPPETQRYVKRLEQLIGAPIRMMSVGPDRTQTIIR